MFNKIKRFIMSLFDSSDYEITKVINKFKLISWKKFITKHNKNIHKSILVAIKERDLQKSDESFKVANLLASLGNNDVITGIILCDLCINTADDFRNIFNSFNATKRLFLNCKYIVYENNQGFHIIEGHKLEKAINGDNKLEEMALDEIINLNKFL